VRTEKGSLRHDANVLSCSGIEADYDAGGMGVDDAVDRLDKAGIHAIVYTSPSHSPDKPRWRVLCPFSTELPPEERGHHLGRLNGLLGGILADESFTLSQSYYYGSVNHNPAHRVEIVDGTQFIDQAHELDERWTGRSKTKPNGSANGDDRFRNGPIDENALVEQIIAGESFHLSCVRLLGRWAQQGVPFMDAQARLFAAFDDVFPPDRDDRWQQRRNDVPRLVRDIYGKQAAQADVKESKQNGNGIDQGVSLDDFWAYMPTHSYIFTPTRAMWPGGSVNSRIPPIKVTTDNPDKPVELSASAFLDRHRAVEQMTWAPGVPTIIEDKLIIDGGWISRPGVRCFNLYQPPQLVSGDPAKAGIWVDHVRYVYPDDAEHIIDYLAHRAQRPQEKINHAIVLGGYQGIGKDTLLEPVKHAVGPWNFQEASPTQVLGRFNGFLKSVILRINEARDLGEFDRFKLYDHMKAYTASPPDVLRVDEKFLREYSILNCCGIIITSNHKTDGIYLPADDRRHYVAWSHRTKEDPKFQGGNYWEGIWSWYHAGGLSHVAAYLRGRDLSRFNPKAPPPKTEAFWAIVNSNRSSETADLADALDLLGNPNAVTLSQVLSKVRDEFAEWLQERKNRRLIPHRFEDCGYTPVRNDDAKDGLWKISGRRQAVYARAELSIRDQVAAVRKLVV
jgi:hypothetical protein